MPPKAAKRKGLSEQEKQDLVLQFLHASLEPWTAKDLIKVVPKRCKGVSFKEVEPIMKALLGDELVMQDKVGVNTLLWSFPATIGVQRRQVVEKKQEELARLDQQFAAAKLSVEALRRDRVACPERSALLARHDALQRDAAACVQALADSEILSLDDLRELAAGARRAVHGANTATDNLSAAVQHMAALRGVGVQDVLEGLEICGGLDYL